MLIRGAIFVKYRKDFELAKSFLNNRFKNQSIMENLKIDTVKTGSNSCLLKFNNGDTWEIMVANEYCARGKRYNIVMYDNRIEVNILNTCILPSSNIGVGFSMPIDIYAEDDMITIKKEEINYTLKE